jgi:hypothetical protein
MSCAVVDKHRTLLGGLRGADDWAVDVGLRNFVAAVGPCVERAIQYDLDHLGIVVTGCLHGRQLIFTHACAHPCAMSCEPDCRVGLMVIRTTLAVDCHFRVQLRDVLVKIGVRRRAASAAVKPFDGDHDTFSRGGGKFAPCPERPTTVDTRSGTPGWSRQDDIDSGQHRDGF